MPKVSICIPTYQRPDLLKVAVDSCLAQTLQDFEIIVSDDSPDTRTQEIIQGVSSKQPIRYVRNVPGLGQARNVNQLFVLTAGEFLVLLHDDNFLMPSALEDLLEPLQENSTIVASFGKDYLAANDGVILHAESELTNQRYSKTDDRADRVQRSAWSVLAAQFPPDGYMVRTPAARKTLYRDDSEVGEACDRDFAYRLAEMGDFFFVGKYLHAYRITEESISSKGLRILLSKLYFMLQRRTVPDDLEGFRRDRLRDLAPVAVNGCLLMADRVNALKILIGPNYPWRRNFVKGAIQGALAFAPRALTEMAIRQKSERKGKAGFAGGLYLSS
ncbi:MAG: glycosyltransferase family 2 protein [Terriglobales bacterium]|jgi:glycosyltransferase involved in cell wall biosynthesis